jgi:zinc-ribbon domain
MFIDLNDPQIENKLLAQEKVYSQLRMTGEEAPAKILSMTDTGIRIGDNASMLQFHLEVFPQSGTPFSANTQQSISDASLPKFAPGRTIYVKFDPNDLKQVAIDHAPVEAPTNTVKCPSCGATQTLTEGQAACAYCGSPLTA